MNPILVEGSFGHGGLGHFLKPTDWRYENLAPKSTVPFDWSKGYDVEHELAILLNDPNFKLPVENQGITSACGGHAVGKHDEVLRAIAIGKFSRRSKKYVYSQACQPGGGSNGGDLMRVVKSLGVSSEVLCPSYENGNQVPTEVFMERAADITVDARIEAQSGKSANYAYIVDFDIDFLAQAIRDNHGLVIGIQGKNNGTWLTANPVPPIGAAEWNHWMYFGKALMVDGKKKIVGLQSWGPNAGDGGWQMIGEDYVNSGFVIIGMAMMFGAPAYIFNKDLYIGMTDADVFFLQKKLNQDPDTAVAKTGAGSPGNESYYFGQLTKAAVIKYQTKHGITPLSGYVGPKTRALLNK